MFELRQAEIKFIEANPDFRSLFEYGLLEAVFSDTDSRIEIVPTEEALVLGEAAHSFYSAQGLI